MTETDLITAGGSSENDQLPTPVNSDISTSAPEDASNSTPTAETAPTADVASGDRAASLSTMVLPELRALAKQIGVDGASGMRKSELVAAIREHRGEGNGATRKAAADTAPADTAPASDPAPDETAGEDRTSGEQADQQRPRRERRGASRDTGAPSGSDQSQGGGQDAKTDADGEQNAKRRPKSDGDKSDGADQQGGQQNRNNQNRNNQNDNDDDGEGRQGRRGRRFRDRRRRERGGDGGGGDRDTELREDDVVQPVAGILDVLDNYAFVRTSGYLAGPNDVYVSMNMVRKNGLRRGDAVTGAVRVPKEGEGGGQNPRQKFNPLVRLDTVNGGPVEDAKNRPEFTKLTPLYPNQRLRLETTTEKLTTRRDRPDHADRQGPARPDRVAAEGR